MTSLADVLGQFGHGQHSFLTSASFAGGHRPLRLAAGFRRQVARALEIDVGIEADAWWAADYRIDWLAGALVAYVAQAAAPAAPRINRSTATASPRVAPRRLVEDNRDDVDLVILSGLNLILIDSMPGGRWAGVQLSSKLRRLDLLHTEYSDTVRQAGIEHPIRFNLLLVSNTRAADTASIWPAWARKGTRIPEIRLRHADDSTKLAVCQCDENGELTAQPGYWKVVEQATATRVYEERGMAPSHLRGENGTQPAS